jgi:hypothetical protein
MKYLNLANPAKVEKTAYQEEIEPHFSNHQSGC